MYIKTTDKLSKTDLEALKDAMNHGDMLRIAEEMGVHRNTVQYTFDPTNPRYSQVVVDKALDIITERILETAAVEGQLAKTLQSLEHLINIDQKATA